MDADVVGPTAAGKPTRRICIAGLCFGLLVVQAGEVHGQQSAVHGEWRSYGADRANTKYTPLAQIDRDNVSKLRVLWRRPGVDPKLTETFPDQNPSGDFRRPTGASAASARASLLETFATTATAQPGFIRDGTWGVSVRRIESEEPSTRRKSGHEPAPFGTTRHYVALRGTRSTPTCSGGGLCPLFRRGVHSWV